MARVGIREVARELGLSVSTVSRAMNARADVSAATVERVRAAAAELGYTPNQTGRTLRRGATNAVAFVVPTASARSAAGETFFLNVANGLQEVLSSAGRDLILLPYGASQDPDGYLFAAADRGLADAYIVAGTQPADPRIEYLQSRDVPLVALGRTTVGNHPWLDLDFDAVAADSIERLTQLGHRRIAIQVTAGSSNYTILFIEGYRRALQRAGLPFDRELIVELPDAPDTGYRLGQRLMGMDDRPTAVVLLEEANAIGLYRFLEEQSLAPGRDLSVIGLRENPVLELLRPRLTCFRLSVLDYGRCLGRLVLAQLDDDPGALHQELWRMELLPGDSDRPVPARPAT